MTPEAKRVSTSHRHWKLNWWDLWPLVDGEQRPIQWTSNSLIFYPHPSSPVVLARAFPSSSAFALPTPNTVINNPGSYSSPSVIEVAPYDEYVFAFFEGRGCDSVACIWDRQDAINSWKINISWQIKPGQGIVMAKWLGDERKWFSTSPPTRAPPLGPSNPFGKTTLFLVNQSHTLQVVHRPGSSYSFQLISASLRHASQASMGDRSMMGDTTNGPGGLRVCVTAAIGLGYNESTIIVVTSSTLIPPPSTSADFPDPFGVSRPSTPATQNPTHSLWESYGPERILHLCEVKLTAYNFSLGISTAPLPPIFPPTASSSRLTNILILPQLHVDDPSSPEGSFIDKGSPSAKEESGTTLHVVLSYLDFEDYSAPKSEIHCFELKRNKGPATAWTESSKLVNWSHQHLATRTITDSAVSFLLSPHTPHTGAFLAGFLDLEGVAPRPPNGNDKGKGKEVDIGKIVMLKIPHLEEDEEWAPSRLMTGADDVDVDPPISAVVSPAGSLICTSPATCSGVSRLGVHTHPRRKNTPDAPSVSYVTESLLSTLLSARPPTDVLHALINTTFPISSVTDVLDNTLRTLNTDEFVAQDWHGVLLGVMVEIFRGRSKLISQDNHPADSKEKALLDERWRAALDLCSVKALEGAFDACKEEDGYDLEPLWQLISLFTWLVDFTEKLLRACVLWENTVITQSSKNPADTLFVETSQEKTIKVKMEAMDVDRDDLFDGDLTPAGGASDGMVNPQLLHVLHPYALDNLIGALSHLNAFRAYLDTLQASAMKASIAKDVIVDVIDFSGINFRELESGLRKVKTELQGVDSDVLRRSFCALSPLPAAYDALSKACKFATSPSAVSKARLFIKPSDLIDGISNLNLSTAKMNQERDIVSKGVLGTPGIAQMCVRCKNKTETGQAPMLRGGITGDFGRWAVWEREWGRCICGGLWIREMSH